jgi:hypothetical protein
LDGVTFLEVAGVGFEFLVVDEDADGVGVLVATGSVF